MSNIMEDALPSELIFAIYKFLTENDLKRTAKALRKEVSLDPNHDSDIDLLEVYQRYVRRKRKSLILNETETVKKFESLEPLEISENLPTEQNASLMLEEVCLVQEAIPKKKGRKKNKSDGGTTMEITENAANLDRKQTGFRRVKTELSEIDPMLRDNSFAKKVKMGGSDKQWGMKACNDFKNTSGKSFRHEKTKKKRGSYRGGSIGMEVCSFKFNNSDESA